jgi:hypothetical protein
MMSSEFLLHPFLHLHSYNIFCCSHADTLPPSAAQVGLQGVVLDPLPKVPETRYVRLPCPLRRTNLTVVPRHYSYECTASSQDRPYAARPSRTQQLFNPKLVPKLTNEAFDK